MSEHDAQKSILEWLAYRRIFHWRNNSGAMVSEYKGRTRFMRFGAVGSPDIFAMRKGVCYGIEVKAEKGRQSDAQKEFQVRFEAGCLTVVGGRGASSIPVLRGVVRFAGFATRSTPQRSDRQKRIDPIKTCWLGLVLLLL